MLRFTTVDPHSGHPNSCSYIPWSDIVRILPAFMNTSAKALVHLGNGNILHVAESPEECHRLREDAMTLKAEENKPVEESDEGDEGDTE